jgi:hypothetical protein
VRPPTVSHDDLSATGPAPSCAVACCHVTTSVYTTRHLESGGTCGNSCSRCSAVTAQPGAAWRLQGSPSRARSTASARSAPARAPGAASATPPSRAPSTARSGAHDADTPSWLWVRGGQHSPAGTMATQLCCAMSCDDMARAGVKESVACPAPLILLAVLCVCASCPTLAAWNAVHDDEIWVLFLCSTPGGTVSADRTKCTRESWLPEHVAHLKIPARSSRPDSARVHCLRTPAAALVA